MMTIDQLDQIAETLCNRFVALGLESYICKSRKSFGNSNYVYVHHSDGHEHKIRISDHSVMNNGRIMDEIHCDKGDINDVIDMVEYYSFPDRFAVVEYVALCDIYNSTLTDEQFSRATNVISSQPFITKKGNQMHNAKVYKTRKTIARVN